MSQQAMTLFKNAELSLASYANLVQGATGDRVSNLVAAGMTSRQATEFALRFPTVITQFNDTAAEGGIGTSFSATVFKDTSGNINVAFRGTLELSGNPNDLIPTDANIFAFGAGYDQIVAMVNWWKREGSEGGLLVDQYQIISRPRTELPPANSVLLFVDPDDGYFLEQKGSGWPFFPKRRQLLNSCVR